jgi:hypothetical protein
MPDVLFDSGKYALKPGARDRLARIAGIVIVYPDLHVQVEGHTDNVGWLNTTSNRPSNEPVPSGTSYSRKGVKSPQESIPGCVLSCAATAGKL